jgi:hypothetical protein
MKSVLNLIAAIIFVDTSSVISTNIFQQVKEESIKKVDQGLGSIPVPVYI